MKKRETFLVFLCFYLSVFKIMGQSSVNAFSVKTNLLELSTTTLNLAAEMRLSSRYTFHLSGSLNPWTFSNNKKFQHWLVRPEGRYWLEETFHGHFLGLHAFHGRFNAGGVSLLGLKHERREGHFTGAGLSYGYAWRLADRLGLEATVGLGYAYQDYERFDCERCGDSRGKSHKNYVGPTQLGVSLIYGF